VAASIRDLANVLLFTQCRIARAPNLCVVVARLAAPLGLFLQLGDTVLEVIALAFELAVSATASSALAMIPAAVWAFSGLSKSAPRRSTSP
jgi:hypothetical protein